ncbi:DUF6207 family protein [Streptomyces sp. NPDC059454]|uniref:DUF6207 family protein n=1 Tax=Streptomyces sp. NPDC059454 TaxID=3346836 RepID=UPI0036AD762E
MRCGRWATATSDRTTRNPEQLSVRLCCLDVRQELSTLSGRDRRSRRRGLQSACPFDGMRRR